MAQVLAQSYETLDNLMEAPAEELETIDGIGPEVTRGVVTYFENEQNRTMVDEIWDAGLTLRNPLHSGESGERPLEGRTFVFTGKLERWTRDEVKRQVRRLGGRATSCVSGGTDYVVAGPGAGSKLDEARSQDIPVIDEEAFVDLMEEHESCFLRLGGALEPFIQPPALGGELQP